MKIGSYDVIGSIAVVKFPDKVKLAEKKKLALGLMRERKNICTVVEKIDKVRGRLRKIKTRYLVGENTKETVHVESGCKFKLDIDKTYFSPRLSGERLEIAKKIKKNDFVLVLFAGVAPYSVVIAKKSNAKKIISVEINKEASKYAAENVLFNKVGNVIVVQGDVKKVVPRLREKFDKIVMPRPQIKESFLDLAFKVSKKGTEIYYYGFGKDSENKKFSDSQTPKKKKGVSDISKVVEEIYRESKKAKKKIQILKIKKAGEIAPYKYRWRVDLKVC